ncbi:YIP1 family protein [Methanocalculus sp.]|uniref:YIP1 family protein n=1 Tax=Methanocalculus sp. TaxID=2004547 RepID=UPI0026121906|nr:YIP1 family protein [Methanocalculus sp.]MDG6250713.1 YIP1 family protein [Methanocalculus sp.]
MSSKTIFNTILRSFQQIEQKPLRDDLLLYFGIVILVYCASFLMMLHEGDAGGFLFLLPFIIVIAGGLLTGAVLLLGTSLIEHFFLLFVDVRKSFEMTMKTAVYALVVAIPLAWAALLIPNIAFTALLIITFVILTFCGIRVFHSLSIDRAAFVSLATGAVLFFFSYRWLIGQG